VLTLGDDTYITVEQADEYVEMEYPDPDPAGAAWRALSVGEKEYALRKACFRLDALPFTGRASTSSQKLMWPRDGDTSVPLAIPAAQMEIALLRFKPNTDTDTGSQDAALRRQLQAQGVKSFSIGDLSESYVAGESLQTQHTFLADEKIAALLSRYLSGGYQTC